MKNACLRRLEKMALVLENRGLLNIAKVVSTQTTLHVSPVEDSGNYCILRHFSFCFLFKYKKLFELSSTGNVCKNLLSWLHRKQDSKMRT